MNDKANANDNKIKIMKKAFFFLPFQLADTKNRWEPFICLLVSTDVARIRVPQIGGGKKKHNKNWGIESACSGDADLENCRWIELI